MSTPIDQLVDDYYKHGTYQRFGQYFFNTYLKGEDESTKGIFYEADFNKARVLVAQFMMKNQWYDLPKKLVDTTPTASRFLEGDNESK